jgi:acetate---CoA ligase (ADP-forming)
VQTEKRSTALAPPALLPDTGLRYLLDPASIAVVGASTDPSKSGSQTLANLLQARYGGRIYPVNPRAAEVLGVKAYPSLQDLPEVPDLVAIVVPAGATVEVLEESARLGARAALIPVAGFAEASDVGRERQERIGAIAREYGIRVSGPNTIGVYNVRRQLPIGYNSSFRLSVPIGHAAIVAHSGAVMGSLGHRAIREGFGLSYLISVGNEADWELCDYLQYCLEDEATRSVGAIIEGLRDGARFLDLVERAHGMGKTVVALKLGRSAHGALVARAHTARMAGQAEVYDAAFHQYGVIATDSFDSFFGALQLATLQPPPRGGRALAFASTGAGAELVADKATAYGVALADISEDTRARLPERRFSAILTNPFDFGALGNPGALGTLVSELVADPANDLVLMLLLEQARRKEYTETVAAAAAAQGELLAAMVGEIGQPTLDMFHERGVPTFQSIDACMSAVAALIRAARGREARQAAAGPVEVEPVEPGARERARALVAAQATAFLPEAETKRLLAEYGLESARAVMARDLAEAQAAARSIGGPVLLKGVAAQLTHKADAGLVSGAVGDEAAVVGAYEAIQANARSLGDGATPLAVSVEEFVPHEFELILGMKHDATFGPVVLVGLGGIYAEVLGDYVLRLAPLGPGDGAAMLAALKASRLLQKAQAQGKVDLGAVARAIERLSLLATHLGDQIAALDVNPLALLPVAQGGIKVLDAKAELRSR